MKWKPLILSLSLVVFATQLAESAQDYRYSTRGRIMFATPTSMPQNILIPYSEAGVPNELPQPQGVSPYLFYYSVGRVERTDVPYGAYGGTSASKMMRNWLFTPDENVTLADFGGDAAKCLVDVGTFGLTALFRERSILGSIGHTLSAAGGGALQLAEAAPDALATVGTKAVEATTSAKNVITNNVSSAVDLTGDAIGSGADAIGKGVFVAGEAMKGAGSLVANKIETAGDNLVEVAGEVYHTGDRLATGVYDIAYKDIILDGVVEFSGNLAGCVGDLATQGSCEVTDVINPSAVLDWSGTIVKDASGTVVAVVVDGILIIVPDSCKDMGTYVVTETIRQLLGITGDKRSKRSVLESQFSADTQDNPRFVIPENGATINPSGNARAFYLYQLKKLQILYSTHPELGLSNPVAEIGNEPNAFPFLPPSLYAWHYSRWYQFLKGIERDQASIISANGLGNSAYFKQLPSPMTIDVMPAGMFTWYGFPKAIRDLAGYFGVRNTDELAYYREFIGSLATYGDPKQMISRANFHIYPFVTGKFGLPLSDHLDHLKQIGQYAASNSLNESMWLTEVGTILNSLDANQTANHAENLLSGLESIAKDAKLGRWIWYKGFGADDKLKGIGTGAAVYNGTYADPFLNRMLFDFIGAQPGLVLSPDAYLTTINSQFGLDVVGAASVEFARFITALFRQFVLWDSVNDIVAGLGENPIKQSLTDVQDAITAPVQPNGSGIAFLHLLDKRYFYQGSSGMALSGGSTIAPDAAAWAGNLIQFSSATWGDAAWVQNLPHAGKWRIWLRLRKDAGAGSGNGEYANSYTVAIKDLASGTLQTASNLTFDASTTYIPNLVVAPEASLTWGYVDFSTGRSLASGGFAISVSSQSKGALDYALVTNDFGFVPSINGPYFSTGVLPPLAKESGSVFYGQDFASGTDLASLGFTGNGGWELDPADRTMTVINGLTGVAEAQTPVFANVDRDLGTVSLEYKLLFPSDPRSNTSYREFNKVWVSLVDAASGALDYEFLLKPNLKSDQFTSFDLQLQKYNGSQVTSIQQATTHKLGPVGSIANWIKVRWEISPRASGGGDGHIRVSVDYGDGNGYAQYIDAADNDFSTFSAIHFKYGPGNGYIAKVDDIALQGQQGLPPVDNGKTSDYRHISITGKVDCATPCADQGLYVYFPQSGNVGRKWYALQPDGRFSFSYIFHRIRETVHEIKLTSAANLRSGIGDPASQPTLFSLKNITETGVDGCIGEGSDCRTFDFNTHTPLRVLANLGLKLSGGLYSWNRLPWGQITSPVDGSSFNPAQPLTLTATAGDLDGTVSSVEFFVDNQSQALVTASPYRFVWSSPTAGSHVVYCVISDNAGGKTVSSPVIINSTSSPVIQSQPQSLTISSGTDAKFEVVASANPVPKFQWYKDGVAIPEGTEANLVIYGASASDAGVYSVVVQNPLGQVRSNGASLAIGQAAPPQINKQPVSAVFGIGQTAILEAAVSGFPKPRLQWYKGGNALDGQIYPSLVITTFTANDSGSYQLTASNASGTVASASAHLGFDPNSYVSPVLERVCANATGGYSAFWGYNNHSTVAVNLTLGDYNMFTGSSSMDLGQPTEFQPGRQLSVYRTDFPGTTSLVWSLSGRTATASAQASPGPCSDQTLAISPILESVSQNADATYTAYWGYSNPNAVSVTIPLGDGNKFSGAGSNQGQPTVFTPGRNRNIFSITWSGQPSLVWTLNGKTATAR